MWITVYFWVLTGIALLAWVLFFLPIWGSGEREGQSGWFTVGFVASVLWVISAGTGLLFDLSNHYPWNGPVDNASMTVSLLRHIQHGNPNLVSEAGCLATRTGSYYFLNDKDGKLQAYYLARNNGVAFYQRESKSQTFTLAYECIRDAYPPACRRLLSDHTYQTVFTFWLPSRTVLRVYRKPRPLP